MLARIDNLNNTMASINESPEDAYLLQYCTRLSLFLVTSGQ